MRYQFVDTCKEQFAVQTLCRVLEVCTSGYYAWRSRPQSARAKRDAELVRRITSAYTASHQTYGSPRVHVDLLEKGIGFEYIETWYNRQRRHSTLRYTPVSMLMINTLRAVVSPLPFVPHFPSRRPWTKLIS